MKQERSISAIIIDDDPFCSFQLLDIITKYALGIEIKSICNNGVDGLAKIRELQPDLVFLDVEMPNMNGFEMIRQLPAINFEIIFITSYEHYAIRAIRFSALDYLMKPIDAEALKEAITRLREKKQRNEPNSHQLEIVGSPKQKTLTNLAVPTIDGLLFISLQDIIWCMSDDKYTKIYTTEKKNVIASRTMGDFEELLIHHGFFRIHKSYLINIKYMKKYIRGEGGQVVMSDGTTLDVSRRKKDELLELVSQFY